ncbi:AMP-binding protein, partial [Frankia tisae]|uniref:AMP-binding protein n=1 Tax=Frankia tisae TaxID=2950104 RepID=UPI0021C0102F
SPAGAVRREPDLPAPLTAFQRDMWLAEQLAPGTPMHTLGLRFRLDGVDDPGRLAAALRALVAGHDAFRAVVREDADGPTLRVGAQPPALPFEVHDLRAIPVRERADRRAELAARRGRTVFDIATGPLLAATAIRLGDREWELVVAVHHLVFDGWSVVVFAERLAALLAGETPAELPSFAGYLRRRRTEPRTFEHWIDRLTAVDTDVEVPADRPRPPVRSFAGATHRITLPLDLLAAVEHAARARATTPSALLLAGVSALIARLSGHGDVTVLSPLAHRDPDTAAGIGAYLTIVPLRVDLSDDPDSATAIGRAGDALTDALGHPDVALDELVRALPVRPHSDRGPLTQVMLNIITVAPARSRRGDIAVEHLGDTVSGGAKLDLNLTVDLARPGAPELAVEYATDLFAPATAARLLEHLLILLRDLVEHPGLPVSRLALLSPAQRDAVLATAVTPAPDTDTDVGDVHDRPRGGTHLLVSEQARLYPNATAVRDGDVSWTYTELERHADVLGARLLAVGVTPGDRVAICLPRGRDAYAAVLAVWRAGAAYVPLDPQYPADRLRYMLADSGAAVVVTRPGTWPGERADTVVDVTVVDVTGNTASAAPLPARRLPWPQTAPTAAAYVIYTSGTTGRPKGVVVAHANLHHAAAMWRHAYDLRPGERHLQGANTSFDVFAGEMLRALTAGGCLVTCGQETLLDPAALAALLVEERIAVVELVPAVLRRLLDHVEPATGGPPPLAGIRVLAGGADAWAVHEYRRAARAVGPGGRRDGTRAPPR